MSVATILMVLAAQTQQPVSEVAVVEVARPILSLPDVLAPPLMPYVACLIPMDRDAKPVPSAECASRRAQAAADAENAIRGELSDHDRREIIEAFLLNVEAIAAKERQAP